MWPFSLQTTALGVALAVALAWGGVQTARLHSAQSETTKLQAAWDTERVQLLSAAVTATAAARDTETRWQAQQKEALNVAQKSTDAARADADAARSAVERLRQRAIAATGSCAASPSASAASSGQAAEPAGMVCADVLGRLAEVGRLTAEFADRAVIAGQACEASWPR